MLGDWRSNMWSITMDKFDVDQFISIIKKQPTIWNTNSESYHDRRKKKAAWDAVLEELIEGFKEKAFSEKNELEKKLMKKWKNIVDSHRRIEKKLAEQAEDSGRRYIYASQLSFLKSTSSRRRSRSNPSYRDPDPVPTDISIVKEEDEDVVEFVGNITNEKAVTEDDSDVYRGEPAGNFDKVPETKRRRNIEENEIDFMNNSVQAPAPAPHDDDKLFFDSIIPAIKTLSMDHKLHFRCEIMRLLSHYRSLESSAVYNHAQYPLHPGHTWNPAPTPSAMSYSHGSHHSQSVMNVTSSSLQNSKQESNGEESIVVFNL